MTSFVKLFRGEMNDTAGEQAEDIWSGVKQGLLSEGGQRKAYEENKRGGRMKRSVRILSEKRRLWKLWKAGGSKDKYLDAKRKANMPSTQPRKMPKRRSLLVFKAIKKTYFVSPNKCVQKIRI